jgi:hypothetical protein
LDPTDTTGPSFPSSPPTKQPSNTSEGQASKKLSGGAKIGIEVGTAIGVIIALAAAATLLYCRNRNSSSGAKRNSDTWTAGDQIRPGELSSNPLQELSQLETTESPIELPTGYGFHQEIGRAI